MSQPIPTFYRLWFTTFDPLLAAFGGFGALFSPLQTLENYNPGFANPPAVETLTLLDVKAGFCVAVAYLQAILLRARPQDVSVWRILQTSNTIVSLGMLGGLMRALAGQGRLKPALWRSGDIMSMGVTVGLLSVRAAFVAGIGVQ